MKSLFAICALFVIVTAQPPPEQRCSRFILRSSFVSHYFCSFLQQELLRNGKDSFMRWVNSSIVFSTGNAGLARTERLHCWRTDSLCSIRIRWIWCHRRNGPHYRIRRTQHTWQNQFVQAGGDLSFQRCMYGLLSLYIIQYHWCANFSPDYRENNILTTTSSEDV